MQRSPLEKACFIKQQANDDDRDERPGGVPDDAPNFRYVPEGNDARQQRHDSTHHGAPTYPKPSGLPDDKHDGGNKDQYGNQLFNNTVWT